MLQEKDLNLKKAQQKKKTETHERTGRPDANWL